MATWMLYRWSGVTYQPVAWARRFLHGDGGGLSDGLGLALAATVALYPDWVLRALFTGWYVGIKAAFVDLALLVRLEFWPVLLAVGGLTALGLVAGMIFRVSGVGLGKWLDLAGMAFCAVPISRLAGAWVRLAEGRPRLLPGQVATEWYAGAAWAAVLVIWMAVGLGGAAGRKGSGKS